MHFENRIRAEHCMPIIKSYAFKKEYKYMENPNNFTGYKLIGRLTGHNSTSLHFLDSKGEFYKYGEHASDDTYK